MTVVIGHDAIHANIGHLPPGQAAGYSTGTGGVPWTANDWITHPGAVRIDQDPAATDHTADVLDVERGAATYTDAPAWYKNTVLEYRAAARPGQRSPAVYASAAAITTLVNALIAGGVKSGPGLWVANWNLTEAQAYSDVVNAAGPFPIVAVQWASGPYYDTDVFSGAWLTRVSGAAPDTAHYTNGTQTLGDLATSRNMQVLSWLQEQERMHPDDAANLAGRAVPPAGTRWWTQ